MSHIFMSRPRLIKEPAKKLWVITGIHSEIYYAIL